jgi:WXXGXW repeat (2 copies)
MEVRMKTAAVPAMLCALLLGACTQTTVAPYPPVPPPVAENVPLPPVSATPLIWQPGHYDWTGTSYAWSPGRWVDRAGHGTLWQDGYWAQTSGGYAWVPPHWM